MTEVLGKLNIKGEFYFRPVYVLYQANIDTINLGKEYCTLRMFDGLRNEVLADKIIKIADDIILGLQDEELNAIFSKFNKEYKLANEGAEVPSDLFKNNPNFEQALNELVIFFLEY